MCIFVQPCFPCGGNVHAHLIHNFLHTHTKWQLSIFAWLMPHSPYMLLCAAQFFQKFALCNGASRLYLIHLPWSNRTHYPKWHLDHQNSQSLQMDGQTERRRNLACKNSRLCWVWRDLIITPLCGAVMTTVIARVHPVHFKMHRLSKQHWV